MIEWVGGVGGQESRGAEVLARNIGEAEVNIALLYPLQALGVRGSRAARIEGSPEPPMTKGSRNCVASVDVACC